MRSNPAGGEGCGTTDWLAVLSVESGLPATSRGCRELGIFERIEDRHAELFEVAHVPGDDG